MLVDGLDDPVDAGITTDSLVLGIDENDFEVLIGAVLVDPVRVLVCVSFMALIYRARAKTYENSEIGAAAANTLLCRRSERALVLELVHTLIRGFAICCTLRYRSFPAATAQELAYRACPQEELEHTVEHGCDRSHSWWKLVWFLRK